MLPPKFTIPLLKFVWTDLWNQSWYREFQQENIINRNAAAAEGQRQTEFQKGAYYYKNWTKKLSEKFSKIPQSHSQLKQVIKQHENYFALHKKPGLNKTGLFQHKEHYSFVSFETRFSSDCSSHFNDVHALRRCWNIHIHSTCFCCFLWLNQQTTYAINTDVYWTWYPFRFTFKIFWTGFGYKVTAPSAGIHRTGSSSQLYFQCIAGCSAKCAHWVHILLHSTYQQQQCNWLFHWWYLC